MKLITAIVFMCVSGVCQEHQVEIEPKACHIGTLHGKVMGADAKFGVKCQER
jgi:galactitol-specific phosphotransferase system IIB component